MKNIILIPTKEKSKLCIRDVDSRFCLNRPEVTYHGENQHMYILCDDAIYIGEWCFELHNGVSKAPFYSSKFTDDKGNIWWLRKANAKDVAGCETTKKIALTTNPYLIFDGVQEITEDFLVWYINNRVDSVDLKLAKYNKMGRELDMSTLFQNHSQGEWKYKIIIPKEVLKTSADWQKIYPNPMVYDADGWDRKNYQYSWFEELISLQEYQARRFKSTCMGMIQPEDEIKPEDIWGKDKVEGLKKFIDKVNNKKETLEEAAERISKECSVYESGQDDVYQGFVRGAKWQQEQHEGLYNSLRKFRNELRDSFEESDFREAGKLKKQIQSIDIILTQFEQLNKE